MVSDAGRAFAHRRRDVLLPLKLSCSTTVVCNLFIYFRHFPDHHRSFPSISFMVVGDLLLIILRVSLLHRRIFSLLPSSVGLTGIRLCGSKVFYSFIKSIWVSRTLQSSFSPDPKHMGTENVPNPDLPPSEFHLIAQRSLDLNRISLDAGLARVTLLIYSLASKADYPIARVHRRRIHGAPTRLGQGLINGSQSRSLKGAWATTMFAWRCTGLCMFMGQKPNLGCEALISANSRKHVFSLSCMCIIANLGCFHHLPQAPLMLLCLAPFRANVRLHLLFELCLPLASISSCCGHDRLVSTPSYVKKRTRLILILFVRSSSLSFESKFMQNPTFSMLCFLDVNGRGLHSVRDSTSKLRFCGLLVLSLRQCSHVPTFPEAMFHQISSTVRDPIRIYLGPLDAPFPVKLSTAYDTKLCGRKVFLFYILRDRSVLSALLSQYLDWNFSLFVLIELGHRAHLDSIILICYCVQLISRILCSIISVPVPKDLSIGQDTIHYVLASSLTFPPMIQETKDIFSTSQDRKSIATIIKFPEVFVEVSLTHHEIACGMLLDCFCLRLSMAYHIYLSIYVVCFYLLVIEAIHLGEDLVNFGSLWD